MHKTASLTHSWMDFSRRTHDAGKRRRNSLTVAQYYSRIRTGSSGYVQTSGPHCGHHGGAAVRKGAAGVLPEDTPRHTSACHGAPVGGSREDLAEPILGVDLDGTCPDLEVEVGAGNSPCGANLANQVAFRHSLAGADKGLLLVEVS
jgi:hypothetical protein